MVGKYYVFMRHFNTTNEKSKEFQKRIGAGATAQKGGSVVAHVAFLRFFRLFFFFFFSIRTLCDKLFAIKIGARRLDRLFPIYEHAL
jgi:hypothetical protein